MSRMYDDSRFGGQRPMCDTPLSASLASTVGATVLFRRKLPNPWSATALQVYFSTGGTNATRQVIVGGSLAGTGTTVYFGTATLGTAGDKSTASFTIAGTLAQGDDLVIGHQGTDAGAFNIGVQVWGVEVFQNL